MRNRPTSHAAAHPLVRGFTLVEILIVVVILAILAAIVVPQFTRAAEETRENSVKMNLFRIRTQIEIYKEHHHGMPPTSHETFEAQMTLATNVDGQTAAVGTDGFHWGPYLTSIPVNPFTGTSNITDGEPGDTIAWYYDGTTGDFRANHDEAARSW
jgi:general secretion pathway protein G